MDKILKGCAYSLDHLIAIEGYGGFIFESGSSNHEHPYYRINLGMKRELILQSEEAYLILDGAEGILIEKLEYPRCKLSELLRRKGVKCRIIADYKKSSSRYKAAWKRAMEERKGYFSENGYALQYQGWADYTFYKFEFIIKKSGWIIIGNHDIEIFRFWYVEEDIMVKADKLIEKALLQPQNLSGQEFMKKLGDAKLDEQLPWFQMIEREMKEV